MILLMSINGCVFGSKFSPQKLFGFNYSIRVVNIKVFLLINVFVKITIIMEIRY